MITTKVMDAHTAAAMWQEANVGVTCKRIILIITEHIWASICGSRKRNHGPWEQLFFLFNVGIILMMRKKN